MKNIVFAKVLDYSLNTQIDNLEDLKQNMRSLENFQSEIDRLQALKDSSQIEHNGLALTLIRKYVMEKKFGSELMRNLIRKYYPLNDEQIVKYDNISIRPYLTVNGFQRYITNNLVYLKKGENFSIGEVEYSTRLSSTRDCHPDFVRDNKEFISESLNFFEYNYSFTFTNSPIFQHHRYKNTYYRNALLRNKFTKWGFGLAEYINNKASNDRDKGIKSLLENKGFMAQQGIDNIDDTIEKLQDVFRGKITEKEVDLYTKKYKNEPYELYSYLPLTESFILEHQDELNWQVLDENPRIEWTLQLVSILLDKFELLSEPEQQKGIRGSEIMYEKVFDGLLNDEIISDLEKLYDL